MIGFCGGSGVATAANNWSDPHGRQDLKMQQFGDWMMKNFQKSFE